MSEKSKEYIAGEGEDSKDILDRGRAVKMSVNSDPVENNVQTLRDLSKVFGGMDIGKDEQHISLLFQEQSPRIIKYLKESTEGGLGGDQYSDMASGIAMLGFEVARSGFGRGEIDSGDDVLNKKLSEASEQRYRAASNVFGQLLQKMYPEGTSREQVLLAQLDVPFGEASHGWFTVIKGRLSQLYEQGVPNEDVELLQYQDSIDGLIETVGDSLGRTAESVAKYGVSGEISDKAASDYKTDMLTLAVTLKELQRLRKESVRHKYGSKAYDQLSPSQLHKIEAAERIAKGIKKDEQKEVAKEEPSFEEKLQAFDSAVLILDRKKMGAESNRLAEIDSGNNEDIQFAIDDAAEFLRKISRYKSALHTFQRTIEKGQSVDPEVRRKSLLGLERIAKDLLRDMPSAIEQVQDSEVKKAMQLMEQTARAMAKEQFPELYKRQMEE